MATGEDRDKSALRVEQAAGQEGLCRPEQSAEFLF